MTSSSPMPPPQYAPSVRKRCLPAVWSRAVTLARVDGAVTLEGGGPGEAKLRVRVAERPVFARVTLWWKTGPGSPPGSPEDEDDDDENDWHCDCGDRNDPCVHVAAATLALGAGTVAAFAEAPAKGARLGYRFRREAGRLSFERVVIAPGRAGVGAGGAEEPLAETLVARVGGQRSGRVAGPPIEATADDFAVDQVLGTGRPARGILEARQLGALLKALQSSPAVTLDGVPVEASGRPLGRRARVERAPGGGARVVIVDEEPVAERFANGAALVANRLRPEGSLDLPENTAFVTPAALAHLVTEAIPRLERLMPVEVAPDAGLPRLAESEPGVELRVDRNEDGGLTVVPRIVYGIARGQPLAVVRGGELEVLAAGLAVRRNPAREQELALRLRHELHLALDQPARFGPAEAPRFIERARGWRKAGTGAASAERLAACRPVVEWKGGALSLGFATGGSAAGGGGTGLGAAEVLAAWRDGLEAVPLPGGQGWAELPLDWLSRYGDRVSRLLSAAASIEGSGSRLHVPEAVALGEELGARAPADLAEWVRRLERKAGAGSRTREFPEPCSRVLRPYQREGAEWLAELGEASLGGLLADDMGLGKTLQALTVLKGRSLVVCPTSVLMAWREQAALFRPDLRVRLHHGPARRLDPAGDGEGDSLVLTTYGILRSDAGLLSSVEWDFAVLDEAQNIRNPDSLSARAARGLRARCRLALTGTPVENRFEDLWSILEYAVPGLLERTAEPERARRLTRPFILRRRKADVAPELPPRIETVLHCELEPAERETYETVLASARREVAAQLESEGSGLKPLHALAALLRLRQACCHPALVPGAAGPPAGTSSKLELLAETVVESVAAGHATLVFSQWTSFLDLIGARLGAEGVPFARLDGSTPLGEREERVKAFQAPDGCPVFLISLKAGGTGLTLTRADRVIIADPWWNPAAEDQAADRAHRIGQDKPVLVQRLVARDTVEDRVLALQARKRALAHQILGGSQGSADAPLLTTQEIIELLSSEGE